MKLTRLEKILTIGVYGFTENSFFKALLDERVDLFCDVRQRRGIRGREYAFANSQRLQSLLSDLGINYLHLKELAPSKELRQQQHSIDLRGGVKKRDRQKLSIDFSIAYLENVLQEFDRESFINTIGDASIIAFFCVEKVPEACHRSLVAQFIATPLKLEVRHIMP